MYINRLKNIKSYKTTKKVVIRRESAYNRNNELIRRTTWN